MHEPRKHQQVIGIDVLRLIAATLVLLYHFVYWDWTTGQTLSVLMPGQHPSWGASLHFGWVGVETFFVISGFVIAYTAQGARPAAFLKGRFIRLAPVSWIAATLVLLVEIATHTTTPHLGLRYLQTMAFWPLNAIDGPWWTLGIEIDFYGLVYLLLRRGRLDLLERIMLGIGIGSGLFWVAALTLQTTLAGSAGWLGVLHGLVIRAEYNRILQLLLVQHGCFFALGVTLWTIANGGLSRRRVAAAGVLAVACLLEIVGQNGIIGRAASELLPAWPALVAWCVSMGLLVLSISSNTAITRWTGHAKGTIRFLGLTTYPLYLMHHALGLGIAAVLAPWMGLWALVAAIAGAFLAAGVVARYLEPRARRGLSHGLSAVPRQSPAGSA
jgi:peptidoglycan/LPS O-acetylase OafA/YrhL